MFKKEVLNRLDIYLRGKDGPIPFMDQEEVECIKSYLNKDQIMLEIGSGTSTLYYPKFVKEYYSMEHLFDWNRLIHNQLRRYPDIKDKVHLYLIPPDKEISSKKDSKIKYYTYINFIEKIGVPKFDIILVDGMARDHCAVKCLNYMDENSIMFIHDYFQDKYQSIHWIEEYFDTVKEIRNGKSLIVLKKKYGRREAQV